MLNKASLPFGAAEKDWGKQETEKSFPDGARPVGGDMLLQGGRYEAPVVVQGNHLYVTKTLSCWQMVSKLNPKMLGEVWEQKSTPQGGTGDLSAQAPTLETSRSPLPSAEGRQPSIRYN